MVLHTDFLNIQKMNSRTIVSHLQIQKRCLRERTIELVTRSFHFKPHFLNSSLGCLEGAVLISIHTLYSEIFNLLLFGIHELNTHDQLVSSLLGMIDVLKRKSKEALGDPEDMNLFFQYFSIPCHVVAEVARYGNHILVDSSVLEHFNSIVKKYIRMKSVQKERTNEEIVRIINSSHKKGTQLIFITSENRTSGLSRGKAKILFRQVIDRNC